MIKSFKIYILTFLLTIFLYSYYCTPKVNAATINASSCSQSNVQTAINLAENGDIVVVPAGNCTWSSKVTVSKKINIIGAGIGNTNITNHGFHITNGTDEWRISGFTFTTSSSSLTGVLVGTENSYSTDGCRNFRIDNCRFINYYAHISIWGHCTGVIDHNDFYGSDSTLYGILRIRGSNASAWTEDTGLGGADFVFIEDNTWDSKGHQVRHCVVGNAGARYVVRYNTFTESGGENLQAIIDAHGYGHGNIRGTRAYEIYENDFIRGDTGYSVGIQIRGGTGVIYNNRFNDNVASFDREIRLMHYRTYDCGLGGLTGISPLYCDESKGGEGYPCVDAIGRGKNQASEPLYIWGNKFDDGTAVTPYPESCMSEHVSLNVDYYYSEKSGYTPYAYPHPLTKPSPPSNLRIVSP